MSLIRWLRASAVVGALAASSAFAQNAKVSTLIPATLPLTGTELFYVVQGGVSKKTPVSSILSSGGVTSVVNNDGTLTVGPTVGAVIVSITHPSLTIGSTNVTLGATATTLSGLSSVTSTAFIGALTGAASLDLPLTGGTLTGPLITPTLSISGITGSTQCLEVNTVGLVSGTGGACGSGGGAVNSVSNTDGTLSIPTTTGVVVASLALGHANTWTGVQTLASPVVTGAFTATGLVTVADLASPSLTIGSTSVTLGATATTLSGLSSVTSTVFVGSLTGAASLDLPLTGGTLTGLLTTPAVNITGPASITQSWSGASNLVALNANLTAASAGSNEVASIIRMTSALGAGAAYKGALGTEVIMNAGSGQGFVLNAVMTVNTGVGAQQANSFEPDFNNFNEDYPLPNQSGYLGVTANAIDIAFGTNGFPGSAAVYHGTLDAGPNYSWHAGDYYLGQYLIKDYTIYDTTNSANILFADNTFAGGTHQVGINFSAATFTVNAWQSPGAAISPSGLANFTGLIVSSLIGSTQCLEVSATGVVSATGSPCGSGSGAVNSVSSPAGTLTISPTTGVVNADIALGHANNWTVGANFAGKVGVGTTSPGANLDVETNSGSGVPRGIGDVEYSADTASPVFNFFKGRGTIASPTAVLSGDTIGNLGFGGFDGATAWTGGNAANAAIRGFATENWSSSAHGSYLTFSTTLATTTSLTERVRIDNAGNVGINTTSPGAKLEVNGTFLADSHILAGPTTPTISACGTGSPAVSGSDTFGKIVTGGGALTSCVVNFGTAFTTAPDCVVSGTSSIAGIDVTASTTQITIGGTSLTGVTVTYHCGSVS